MNYQEFIENKKHSTSDYGFEPVWEGGGLFDFQSCIVDKAVRKGRLGIFADTGLGKTAIQLAIAQNIVMSTNGRVLILTPLAVAFQFIDEAGRMGIDDIEHSKDGSHVKKIVVCNYERLHLLNPSDYRCVMLDESSILKNFDGKIKSQILGFIKKVQYRFLSTATPSPNDFIELGNSSEALGYMGYMDMLGRFFRNNQNSSDTKNIGEKFYLKPHAEKDFFSWVNQWGVFVKKPSDLGYSDERYELPDLVKNICLVKSNAPLAVGGQHSLFALPAKTMTEVREEQKMTVVERCERAASLSSGKVSVYWCNLNEESEIIGQIDSEAVEVRGGMSIDKKEDILIAFAKGEIERLITKPKMTSMGLNWQHCNHTVYFPTWSYEQYYQSIRRFWRYGQTKPVEVDIVVSEGQERVLQALEQKTQKAIELYEKVVSMANSDFNESKKEFNQKIKKPEFLSCA